MKNLSVLIRTQKIPLFWRFDVLSRKVSVFHKCFNHISKICQSSSSDFQAKIIAKFGCILRTPVVKKYSFQLFKCQASYIFLIKNIFFYNTKWKDRYSFCLENKINPLNSKIEVSEQKDRRNLNLLLDQNLKNGSSFCTLQLKAYTSKTIKKLVKTFNQT